MDNEKNKEFDEKITQEFSNLKNLVKDSKEKMKEKTVVVDPFAEEKALHSQFEKRYNEIEEKTKETINKKVELSNRFETFYETMSDKLGNYFALLDNIGNDDIEAKLEKINEFISDIEKLKENDKLSDEEKQNLDEDLRGLKELESIYLDVKNLKSVNDLVLSERNSYIKDYTDLENEYSNDKKDFSRFEDVRMKDINNLDLVGQAKEYNINLNDETIAKEVESTTKDNKTGDASNKEKDNKDKTEQKNKSKDSNGIATSYLPTVIDPSIQGQNFVQEFLKLNPDNRAIFFSNIDNCLRLYNAVNNVSQSNSKILFFRMNSVLKDSQRKELRGKINKSTALNIVNADKDKEAIFSMFSKLSNFDNVSLENFYNDLYKNYCPSNENPYIMNGKLSDENNDKIEEMIRVFNEKLANGEVSESEKTIFENYVMKPIISSSINKTIREMGTISNLKLKIKGWSPKINKTEKLIPSYVEAVEKSKSNMNNNLRSQVQSDDEMTKVQNEPTNDKNLDKSKSSKTR